MHWPLGARWLAALSRGRQRRRVVDEDPAGMGTAFGLDASTILNGELAEEFARLTAPGALGARTAPGTPGALQSRLESRLHRRSTL
jgi:hypothetical protein